MQPPPQMLHRRVSAVGKAAVLGLYERADACKRCDGL